MISGRFIVIAALGALAVGSACGALMFFFYQQWAGKVAFFVIAPVALTVVIGKLFGLIDDDLER